MMLGFCDILWDLYLLLRKIGANLDKWEINKSIYTKKKKSIYTNCFEIGYFSTQDNFK